MIRATKGAHNALLDIEELEEIQLDVFRTKYEALAELAREQVKTGNLDTDTPESSN
jgi:Low affinity iron permease